MAANTNNILSNNCASTNITTAAYVELTSSSSGTPINTSKLWVWNGTSSILKLATGVSGSQTDLVAVGPSMQVTVDLPTVLASGSHVWAEAVDATASTKFITVALQP